MCWPSPRLPQVPVLVSERLILEPPLWRRLAPNRSSKPWNRPPGGQAGARSKAVHQRRDRCGDGGVRAARLGESERHGWSTVADLRVGASLDGMLVALLAATGVPLRGLRLGECGLAAQR